MAADAIKSANWVEQPECLCLALATDKAVRPRNQDRSSLAGQATCVPDRGAESMVTPYHLLGDVSDAVSWGCHEAERHGPTGAGCGIGSVCAPPEKLAVRIPITANSVTTTAGVAVTNQMKDSLRIRRIGDTSSVRRGGCRGD